MTTIVHAAVLPRDGLFCKDGRGWHTSTSGRGHGLDWPWPSTVLGALRSAWGRGEEARMARRFDKADWRARTASMTLGRTLVLRRPLDAPWTAAHRVWPAPADARRLEGQALLHQLSPAPSRLPTLGRDDDAAREALWLAVLEDKAKPLPVPRWWSDARLAAWLAGEPVAAGAPTEAFDATRRIQAHVAIQPDLLVAEDGALYSHDIVETLEPRAEWALGVEVDLPTPGELAIATLGSDSRLARIQALPATMFDPPPQVLNAFRAGCRGLRVVVTTPACFTEGWLPDGLERHGRELRGTLGGLGPALVLRAAMVPRPVHISGWDLAEGAPKPTARMVAPGAVYFFERADGGAFGEADARALWLAAVGARTHEGFGRLIPGIWNPTRNESLRSEP